MPNANKTLNEKIIGWLAFYIGISISFVLIMFFLPNKILVSPLLLFGIVVLSNLAGSISNYERNGSEKNIFSKSLLANVIVSIIFSSCLTFIYFFFSKL